MTKEIKLSRGMVAIVDDDDYHELNKHRWYAQGGRWGIFYAARCENGKYILMHRQILDPQSGMTVDHINHNGLDNRRCNIRVATQSENNMNRGKSTKGTCKYKGAYYYGSRRKWRATIRLNKKTIHIGYFETELEAAKAYDEAAKKYFGEFAMVNQYECVS